MKADAWGEPEITEKAEETEIAPPLSLLPHVLSIPLQIPATNCGSYSLAIPYRQNGNRPFEDVTAEEAF